MTDKRIKLDCPFCGTASNKIELTTICKSNVAGGLVRLKCPNCGVEFIAQSKQAVINLWNCRV